MANQNNPNPFKVIMSNLETLDNEIDSHKDNCLTCINGEKCKTYIDLLESHNFYYLAMRRYRINSGEQNAERDS